MEKAKKKPSPALVKGLIVVGVVVAICVLTWVAMTYLFDAQKIKDTYGDSFVSFLIIGVLQFIQVIFIPISNQIITLPAMIVFNDPNYLWKIFLASFAGIEAGTIVLYFLGRYGGVKLLNWILSDKSKVETAANFLNRGRAFYPIGMLVGFIPDDILTTLAGTSKYNFWYVLLVSFVTRAICVATTVWGLGLLTKYWWGWVILSAVALILVIVTIWLFAYQNKDVVKKVAEAVNEKHHAEEHLHDSDVPTERQMNKILKEEEGKIEAQAD